MSETVRYPEELTHTVTTTDGTPVVVRAIRPEDAERLIAFYERLSEHTAYQRFFTVMKRLPPDWTRLLANVDYVRRLALIAEVQTPGGPELISRFTTVVERKLDSGVVEATFTADAPV